MFVRVARTLGATDMQLFWRVIVPFCPFARATALRVALGVSWATSVAAGCRAARPGRCDSECFELLPVDRIYVGIICIGGAAVLMDALVRVIANER